MTYLCSGDAYLVEPVLARQPTDNETNLTPIRRGLCAITPVAGGLRAIVMVLNMSADHDSRESGRLRIGRSLKQMNGRP
jgi:hypothetical protein